MRDGGRYWSRSDDLWRLTWTMVVWALLPLGIELVPARKPRPPAAEPKPVSDRAAPE